MENLERSIVPADEVWLTSKEVIEILDINRMQLSRLRTSGKIIAHSANGNGGRGREGFVYLLSSLPEEAKLKYYSAQAPKEQLNNVRKVPGNSSGDMMRKMLNRRDEQTALARADLVSLYIKIKKSREFGDVVKAKKAFVDAFNNGSLPELLKITGKVSLGTLERWKKTYLDSKKDFNSLAPKYKRDKSTSVTIYEADLLIKKALSPNQPLISEIVEQTKDELFLNNFPEIKSDITYRRYLEKWQQKNKDMWVFFREGGSALNDKVLSYIDRDPDSIGVGDIIVADGHNLNFEVINPFTGKPKNHMTLILFYDMRSNMPLGWEIMPTENVRAIAVAMFRAILRLGKIPRVCYIDNGRAFGAKFFKGVDLNQSGITGLFEKLDMKVITAWPYHGQSKTIERFFGTFAALERMMPTYTGTSIQMQPAWMNRGEKLHRRLHEKIMENISIDMLTTHRAVAWWFDKYAAKNQKGKYLKDKCPNDLFLPGQGPGIDRSKLIYLMMKEEDVLIKRCEFSLPGLGKYRAEALYGLEGQFDVRYDFVENEIVYVHNKNGNLICEAEKKGMQHAAAGILGTAEDVEKLKDEIAFRNNLYKSTTTDARDFLQKEIYPAAQRMLIEADVIRYEEKQVKQENDETIKLRKTGTDNIDLNNYKPLLVKKKNKEEGWI